MSAGKGDTPRPVDPKKYGENYDRIFRKTKIVRREVRNHHGKIVAYVEYDVPIKSDP